MEGLHATLFSSFALSSSRVSDRYSIANMIAPSRYREVVLEHLPRDELYHRPEFSNGSEKSPSAARWWLSKRQQVDLRELTRSYSTLRTYTTLSYY